MSALEEAALKYHYESLPYHNTSVLYVMHDNLAQIRDLSNQHMDVYNFYFAKPGKILYLRHYRRVAMYAESMAEGLSITY